MSECRGHSLFVSLFVFLSGLAADVGMKYRNIIPMNKGPGLGELLGRMLLYTRDSQFIPRVKCNIW